MLVRFWTSNYAPCMVQAELVNRRVLERVLRTARANGFTEHETTALVSYEDAASLMPRRRFKELEEGWDVTVRVDRDEALNLYGYDACNTEGV